MRSWATISASEKGAIDAKTRCIVSKSCPGVCTDGSSKSFIFDAATVWAVWAAVWAAMRGDAGGVDGGDVTIRFVILSSCCFFGKVFCFNDSFLLFFVSSSTLRCLLSA
jgi:hypothetical protein